MNKASAFRIKQADGTYGDPIVFGLDKREVWPSTKEIPENADLNDYKTPGAYNCPTNAAVATLDNTPTEKAFSLIVYRTGNSNSCVQYLSVFSTGLATQGEQDHANRIFTRTYYWDNDWSPWAEIVTSLDRPVDYTSAGWTLDTYADHCWHKMATFRSTNTNTDRRAVFLVTDSLWNGTIAPNGRPDLKIGLLHVHIRKTIGACASSRRLSFNLNTGYDPNDFVLVYNPVDDSDELWTRIPTRWDFRTFNLIETGLNYGGNRYYQTTVNPIEMYRRVRDSEGYDSYPTGEGYVVIVSENSDIMQPSKGIRALEFSYAGSTNGVGRLTSANNLTAGGGVVKYFNATSSMTVENGAPTYTDGTTRRDAHVLHMPWDSAGGYDSMLALPSVGATPLSDGSMGTVTWRAGLGDNGVTTDENGNVIQTGYTDWFHLIDDRFTIDGVHVKKQHTTHYGVCSTAAATVAKTVDIPHFELVTGAIAFVRFSVTNSGAVASLTLNISNTGAKPIKYRNANLSAANVLSANRTYLFVYDGTNWQIVGDLDTNTNYYDRLKRIGGIYPKENLTTTTIVVNDGTGYFKLDSRPFDITYSILETGAAFTSGTMSNNVYSANGFAIKNTQDFTMTQHAPVFIKGTLNGVMFTPVSNTPLVQTLPSTEDGYQYIYLGYAYSTSNIQLVQTHPIVEYVNGAIRPYHTAFATNADIDAMF